MQTINYFVSLKDKYIYKKKKKERKQTTKTKALILIYNANHGKRTKKQKADTCLQFKLLGKHCPSISLIDGNMYNRQCFKNWIGWSD